MAIDASVIDQIIRAMTTIATSNIQLTISLSELDLDDEELQAQVENLLPQIREVHGVEEAGLVEVTEVPESSKSLTGYVLGMLKTVLDKEHLKNVFGFLRDRFAGKPETIKLVLKAPDGRELNLEASNEEDFASAMQLAENFLNNTKSI
jgi:hypothetical protein